MLSPSHLDRDSAVYIAGHTGLVGSALWRSFHTAGFTNLIGASSRELDLRDRESTLNFFDTHRPPEPINVGAGVDISIRDLTDLIAGIVGFTGEIVLDHTKPDGTPRKLLDISRLAALGWQPNISLRDGIRSTYAWFAQEAERMT